MSWGRKATGLNETAELPDRVKDETGLPLPWRLGFFVVCRPTLTNGEMENVKIGDQVDTL